MKKIIISSLLLTLSLSITACGKSKIEPFTTNSAITTPSPTATTQPFPDLLIDTEFYTVSIPNNWENDCFYIIGGGYPDYSLAFFDKASMQADENGMGGELFTILLTENPNYSLDPSFEVLGSLEIPYMGCYNIVVFYPTDIHQQYIEETAVKYYEMYNEIPNILKSISFKEGCTFSADPLPVVTPTPIPLSSRANGSWVQTLDIATSINLIIRSDGSFLMAYNSYGKTEAVITGTYEILSDDGQYQTFCFYSSDNDSWVADIYQTVLTDRYGTQFDGLVYVNEVGETSYYTGIKYLD